MPFRGAASATSAVIAATASAAIGWNRPGGNPAMLSSAPGAAPAPGNCTERGGRVMGEGRGGAAVVAALADSGHALRADQAGAADNDDLHCASPSPVRNPNGLRVQPLMKARRSALTTSACVVHMPCGNFS